MLFSNPSDKFYLEPTNYLFIGAVNFNKNMELCFKCCKFIYIDIK